MRKLNQPLEQPQEVSAVTPYYAGMNPGFNNGSGIAGGISRIGLKITGEYQPA